MARFAVTGNLAITGAVATVAALVASANKRPKLNDWIVGASGSPGDNQMLWSVEGFNADTAGTSTSVTPKPLDPADPPSDTGAEEDYTVEPTSADGIPWVEMPVNDRASYRWIASPGGELIIAATANLKMLTRVVGGGYTGVSRATMHFKE